MPILRASSLALALATVFSVAVALSPLATVAKAEENSASAEGTKKEGPKKKSLELSEADVAAIKETFKTATDALVAEDWKVWSKFWAKNAVLMPPGHATVTGLKDIRKFVQEDLSELKDFELSDWTVEGVKRVAIVTTGMEWTFEDGKTKKGKQLVVLVKSGKEGVWRAQKVAYNLN